MSGMSLVIPTHGRRDLVARLLKSIAEDKNRVNFEVEVILVDDSPRLEAGEIMQLAAAHGAAVFSGVTQVGEKRNVGALHAKHEIVLFLDSDVIIRPGTLGAHMDGLSSAPENVAGCLGKTEFVGSSTYPWRVIEAMQLTLPFSYPDVADRVPWGPTANLSVRRQLFLMSGGFDTSLPRYGGEDVDLGLRMTDQGLMIMTAPRAVAEHAIDTWNSWRQNLPRLWSFGLADYHLLVRHPRRSFLDFPTGPMLWVAQILTLSLLVAAGYMTPGAALCAFAASLLAYPLVYALVKGNGDASLVVHLPGPLIFWIMDLAKAFESVRRGHPLLIFRRLKFLDDLISHDWKEIAASAWGLTASAVVFVFTIMIGRT